MPLPTALFSSQITEGRYYCPEKIGRNERLQIRSVGREQCRQDYFVERETFPWWAIELVMQGEGYVEFGQKRFPLGTGSLFCYGPGVAHRIVTSEERPLLKYFIDFSGAKARQMLAQGALRPGQTRYALYPQELQEILERIIQEGNRKARFSTEIVQGYLNIFFHKLHEGVMETKGDRPSRTLETYLRAQGQMEKNFTRFSRLEDIAGELNLSPETLCRLFQHYAALSPYQYLLRLKMNLAVDLLLSTDLLVKEVGQRIGMEDPFHFSRLFKQSRGVAPEEFRRLRQRTFPGKRPGRLAREKRR